MNAELSLALAFISIAILFTYHRESCSELFQLPVIKLRYQIFPPTALKITSEGTLAERRGALKRVSRFHPQVHKLRAVH